MNFTVTVNDASETVYPENEKPLAPEPEKPAPDKKKGGSADANP